MFHSRNNRSILGALALLLGLMSVPALAVAQTTGQGVSNGVFSDLGQGQSFKATVTGTITAIAVRPSQTNTNDTLRIYTGALGSGVPNNPGTAAYTQLVDTVAVGGDQSPLQSFTLSTPFPVVAGTTYTFIFDNARPRYSSLNPYSDGGQIVAYGNPIVSSSYDLAFQVTQFVPGGGVASVPTMSEWAMILFGTVLAGGAALYIQRRRFTA